MTAESPCKTICQEDDASLAELAELCEKREAMYAFVARLYRVEVDQQLLDELRHMRVPASSGNDNIDEGNRRILGFLGGLWEGTLTDLAVDYARTFIGRGVDGFSAAYPYESVYTSAKRLLMQEARDEVVMTYRAHGVDKDSSWKDAEDHIALELEFMRLLAERTVEAARAGDEGKVADLLADQASFMEEHLSLWVPMMTADMRKFAKTGLYQGLSYLIDGLLEMDGEFLAGIVSDDRA